MSKKKLRVLSAPESPVEARIAQALHKLGLAQKHETWLLANEAGLSPTQGQILALLAQSPLRASQIAEQLGVTAPTVSDSLRALLEKELVEKKRDENDARASQIHLTAAGKKHAVKATGWPELFATAARAMAEDEKEIFYGGVLKMIRALQESGRIPISRMCVTCVHFKENVHQGAQPHHCAFVDAPIGTRELRIDCEDHLAS